MVKRLWLGHKFGRCQGREGTASIEDGVRRGSSLSIVYRWLVVLHSDNRKIFYISNAYYHDLCLVSIYNDGARFEKSHPWDNSDGDAYHIKHSPKWCELTCTPHCSDGNRLLFIPLFRCFHWLKKLNVSKTKHIISLNALDYL